MSLMDPAPVSILRRINHIGVLVEDLDEARRWLAEVLHAQFLRTVDLPEGRVSGEFFRAGDIEIEVFTISDAPRRRELLGSAKARVEHIAVEVTDLPAVVERLVALGVKFRTPAPRRIRDTLNAWTVADTTGGISFQLTQHLNV